MLGYHEQSSRRREVIVQAKVVLNFLTVIWRRGFRESLLGKTISQFLNFLAEHLSQESPDSLSSTMLCDTLLTTLATFEIVRSDPSFDVVINKLWEDETIWKVAMEFGPSDLPVACKSNEFPN
jgi:hypothetical protein